MRRLYDTERSWSQEPSGCSLASAALGGDRPDRFHSVSSVDRVDAVQVHRRVTMARQQAYDVAEAQINRAAIHPNQRAVFVAGKVEHEVIPPKDLRRPSVAAGSLLAGINNDPVRRRLADHTSQDRQGRAKGRQAALFVPADLSIARVHEDVTARLKLLQDPKIEIKAHAARPTSGQNLDLVPAFPHQRGCLLQTLHRLLDGRTAFLMGDDALQLSLVALQACKAEAAVARDRVRKVGRSFWRVHAASVLTDIDLHENVKRGSRADGCLGDA